MSCCPHCGASLVADRPLERDGFGMDPRGTVAFHGMRVPFTFTEAVILHTIADAAPRPVPCVALVERIGSEAADPNGLMQVRLCAMKKKLAGVGAPWPVRNIAGHGWRWEMSA